MRVRRKSSTELISTALTNRLSFRNDCSSHELRDVDADIYNNLATLPRSTKLYSNKLYTDVKADDRIRALYCVYDTCTNMYMYVCVY